jgi:sarcosine oxidase
MRPAADIAIVGLGAMGSATAAALGRQRAAVVGFDRFTPPHDRGSSHGRSRVIREAYFEHPLYVPLVQRAFNAWRALERRSGRQLLRQTGALLIGDPSSAMIRGTRQSAERHGLAFESLGEGELRRRFPQFEPPAGSVGVFEPTAGILAPEECIRAFLDEAAAGGVELRFEEPVLDWRVDGGEIVVESAVESYRARRLLLAAGAWLPEQADGFGLEIERQVMHWFEPLEADLLTADRFPIFLIEEPEGGLWYGLPDCGDGIKIAIHHDGEATSAAELRREVDDADIRRVRDLLSTRLPVADGAHLDSTVCMYTNTADGHFVIDRHPDYPQVTLASVCSGHGFKFASVVGDLLADLLTRGATDTDLAPFAATRATLRRKV